MPEVRRHLRQGEPDPSRLARRKYAATHQCYLWELEFPPDRRISASHVGTIRRPDALSLLRSVASAWCTLIR